MDMTKERIRFKPNMCFCMFLSSIFGIVAGLYFSFNISVILFLVILLILLVLKFDKTALIVLMLLATFVRTYSYSPTKTDIRNVSKFGITVYKEPVEYEFIFADMVNSIRSIPQKVLGEKGAYVSGVLFGDKSGMNSETKSFFRKAGISHILAVSGLHIGILMNALALALKKCKKKPRLFILYFALVLMMTLSGFSPSVLRAGLMMAIYLFADVIGERYNLLHSLFIAGTIVLMINPYILFDAGFLLSFTATLGIGMLNPALSANLENYGYLGSNLAMYIGCQVTTLPIMLYFFNEVALLGILGNLVAVYIVVFALVSGMIGIMLYPLGISFIPLGLSASFMKMIELWSEFIANIPNGTLYTNSISLGIIVLYYLLLCVPCIVVFKDRRNYYLLLFAAFGTVFSLSLL